MEDGGTRHSDWRGHSLLSHWLKHGAIITGLLSGVLDGTCSDGERLYVLGLTSTTTKTCVRFEPNSSRSVH